MRHPDLATQDLARMIRKAVTWAVAATLVFSVASTLVLNYLGLSFFSVHGSSMEPALRNGSSVVLRQSRTVARGQVVFFNLPQAWASYKGTGRTLVKRIAAVPGDVLSFDGHVLYVNGEPVYDVDTEGYECSAGDSTFEHVLTSQEIFVMGDNAHVSLDSRRIFCDGQASASFVPRRAVRDHGDIIYQF